MGIFNGKLEDHKKRSPKRLSNKLPDNIIKKGSTYYRLKKDGSKTKLELNSYKLKCNTV